MPPRSLYVHIPFCASRCFYCDFNSFVAPDSVRAAYVEALARELALLRDEYFGAGARPPLDTVFFGGGTPTLLTAGEWDLLADRLDRLFAITGGAEWTVEANPGTVDGNSLRRLRALGVNRLSLGAQTLNDALLMAIGRLHAAEDVLRSVGAAQEAGFTRLNLDFMLGLPGQTTADVEASLEGALAAGVNHVSAYGLKVEEGTPFADWQRRGLLHLPDEELEADMYEWTRTALAAGGLAQYEISNFAAPGEPARHNLVYWENLPYLAAGAGAHGYAFGRRYENERSLAGYAAGLAAGRRPVARWLPVPESEAMENTMMLGLRLAEGVSHAHFERLHGASPRAVFRKELDRLEKAGLLRDDGRRIVIPAGRFAVANAVFAAFVGALTA